MLCEMTFLLYFLPLNSKIKLLFMEQYFENIIMFLIDRHVFTLK